MDTIPMNAGLRLLATDELDVVAGGQPKTIVSVRVERCKTTILPNGTEVQKCKVIRDDI